MLDLNTLTLDQLRKLCKKVGVNNYINNRNRFQCRKALWAVAQHQEGPRTRVAVTMTDRTTNNIIRISNILFSHQFLDSFLLALNDIRARAADHGRGRPVNDFWGDVAEAMNSPDDVDMDANNILQIILSEEDEHYEDMNALDLKDCDTMTPTAIKKKVIALLNVRKAMQKKMTAIGAHGSNPYNFVEDAMKRVGKKGLSVLGCYYFFQQCEIHPEVDAHHPSDDGVGDGLNGNNAPGDQDLVVDLVSTNVHENEKKRAYAAMAEISGVAKEIAVEMREMRRLAQESTNALKERNRLAKQSQLIELAKHLGKYEILRNIMASLSSASGN